MDEYFVPYGNRSINQFVVGKLYKWTPSSHSYYGTDHEQDFSYRPNMNPVMLLEVKHINKEVVEVKILTAQAEIAWIRVHELFCVDWKIINS